MLLYKYNTKIMSFVAIYKYNIAILLHNVDGQFRGKRDKGLEQKLLTGHIVIVYFYRP